MADRALDVMGAAGRGLAAAARRLGAMERGLTLFLLSIALFLVGLTEEEPGDLVRVQLQVVGTE
jgi:hypothetical protein